MATIKDVARHAGVSHSTVSRILNGNTTVAPETRLRVMEAIKHLKYSPNQIAKALKAGKVRTIALVLPRVDWTIFPPIIAGVQNRARERGYLMILCDTNETFEIEREYINRLKNRTVDGFIMCTYAGDDSILRQLKEECIPVVSLLRGLEMPLVDMVVTDNMRGSGWATQHLLDRGCRRIAFIKHPERFMPFRERFLGYNRTLLDNGIPVDPDLIVHDVPVGFAGSHKATEGLLDSGVAFDGILCSSDAGAMGALHSLAKRGLKVPEQVKVMGYGGDRFVDVVAPRLTTMVQPSTLMGEMATDRLIDLIEGGSENHMPLIQRLEAKLAPGETT